MRSHALRKLFVLGALGMGACGGDNPLRETALGVVSAATAARSVSLAMVSIASTPRPCVSVTTACTSYPCQGAVTVQVGSSCPYPLDAAASGSVNVTGQWTSATDATLSLQFVDVKAAASNEAIALAQVTALSATRSGNNIAVSYTGANAGARSGLGSVAVGGSSSWKVDIDTAGTDDTADDKLTVSATSAAASAGLGVSAKTVSLDGILIDPSCALNPIAGTGSITEISTFIPKITKISFHPTCDGKGTVNGDSYAFDTTP